MMTALTINANALHIPLADASVQCIATSPPYYGLRDYGLPPTIWGGEPECQHVWGEHQIGKAQRQRNGASGGLHEGRAVNGLAEIVQTEHSHGSFCQLCGAWRGCLGLEPTPELYVEHLVAIGCELRRVLREDGTLWLNLGDSYASIGRSARKESPGVGAKQEMDKVPRDLIWHAGDDSRYQWTLPGGQKPKDLIGIPWRVALALQADGWYLRSDIIWAKPNPMPESVTDRPTKSHEYVFLLTKSARYFWDQEAVREANMGDGRKCGPNNHAVSVDARGTRQGHSGLLGGRSDLDGAGRNLRSVWTIATSPYSGAHFATWPPKLVEPMILAGTSARGCCSKCGRPWERVTERDSTYEHDPGNFGANGAKWEEQDKQSSGHRIQRNMNAMRAQGRDHDNPFPIKQTLGWRAACDCDAGDPVPCTVLDPFCGSGTTGRVAIQHGRRFIGLDLNSGYLGELAAERLDNVQVRLGL